jgi:large subunit ribosomal protein L13
MAKDKEKIIENQIIIDASDTILGRFCTFAAKQALLGKNVVVVNCSKAIVSGKRSNIIAEYHKARARGGTSLKGPHYPKSPERIVKRAIRGMLSFPKGRAISALKRVICYNDVPYQYESSEKINMAKKQIVKTMTLLEICKEI